MPSAPSVSIVIPVFDDAETVAEALDSCLAQTSRDFEVICVDDASTDNTAAVIERYAARDARIRLIRHDRNLSAFQARRAGILAAAADYVLFLDGDDTLLPGAVATSVRVAKAQRADLVGFGIEVVTPDGALVGGYQNRLRPKHDALTGDKVLGGLFPVNEPAQGQLWRYLFRTELLRDAYSFLPADLELPRVNDLPLMYVVAALASRYVSISERLYRYTFGRGGSGRAVDSIEQAKFYSGAIRSIESIAPAVRAIARTNGDPGTLLDNYESVRLSIIGYVCSYFLTHTPEALLPPVLDHLYECAPATDVVLAAVRFYPESLDALKRYSKPVPLGKVPVRSVLLTTRKVTTGGVSGVLLAQATFLLRAGYRVTIVARRHGSDPRAVPAGVEFIEMVGRGLPDRIVEWAEICRTREVDVVVDHQVLYSRDWPEYALAARAAGIPTIGWLHSFAGRPIYDLNGLHALLKDNAPLLETVVTLSALDVSFWKLRGIPHSVYLPNPPSPLLLDLAGGEAPRKAAPDGRIELAWWGRLDERTKRVSQLIDVADALRRLGADFHITVIGPDGADYSAEEFNAAARERGLEGMVEAVGERRGPALLESIDQAHAFVSTSVIEGYQLTIAEAQARGLPVFMYELPWLTLVQGNGGVVAVRQGDAAALAQQIVDAVLDPVRFGTMSKASVVAARSALAHDFGRMYEQVITGTLPAEFSPEPTLDDSRRLLDLLVFYAEENAGLRAAVSEARKTLQGVKTPQRSMAGPPSGRSLGQRAWRAATPFGRTMLQIFPGLRPAAHRLKRRLVLRRR